MVKRTSCQQNVEYNGKNNRAKPKTIGENVKQ